MRRSLPQWFTSRFPSRYISRSLFSTKMPAGFGLQPLPETPDGPLVSAPEGALLEMLSDVGVQQGVEEARNIMEGVRSLRAEVLATLLKNCLRVKVARLCVQWAEELNLDWAAAARKSGKLGKGGKTWYFKGFSNPGKRDPNSHRNPLNIKRKGWDSNPR